MTMFLLLICSLIAAVVTYFACPKKIANVEFSRLMLSLFMGFLTACILFFAEGSKTPATKLDYIIVGTSSDFPPFTFIQDGKMTGFDVDLIEEIGRRLDKKVELKNMPFGTLLPSLQLGTIDVIASGLTETPERAKQVLFTTAYLENNPLVIVSLSSAPANTIQDLNNKEVIVNEGYTADLYMSKITGPVVKRLKSPAQAFLALQTGRALAFLTARNTIKPFFDQYGTDQFHIAVIPNTEESASLAVAPSQTTLHEQIQFVLNNMKKDGSLQQLKNKWGL